VKIGMSVIGGLLCFFTLIKASFLLSGDGAPAGYRGWLRQQRYLVENLLLGRFGAQIAVHADLTCDGRSIEGARQGTGNIGS
jgi:hypothetical protein